MKKGITKISLLVWILAIGGFVSSTMHYHGDSMHCLEHGNEPHFTENDNVCPICVIQHVEPSMGSTFVVIPFVREVNISSFYNFVFEEPPTSFKPERAPPFLT